MNFKIGTFCDGDQSCGMYDKIEKGAKYHINGRLNTHTKRWLNEAENDMNIVRTNKHDKKEENFTFLHSHRKKG